MTDPAAGFLEACGSVGPLILGIAEPGASSPSWRILDRPFAVVGRSPGADLYFNDPAVSRRHAYLQMIGGRLFCVDLQSRTGTHWGGEAGVWGWIDPDVAVGVGPFAIRPRGDEAGVPPRRGGDVAPSLPTSRAFDQPGLAEVTLEIAGRVNGPATWRVSRALTLVGASSSCKIRLGGGVAGIHASLVRTPAGVFAVDLLGPGGISLNGERVGCAPLGPGDELAIGPHVIRVRRALKQLGPAASGTVRVPTAVDAGAGIESLVRELLDEFGRSHERGADRLEDVLVGVLESIAGMHREQMALIGEGLAQIRRLAEGQRDFQSHAERPAALRIVSRGTSPVCLPGRTHQPDSPRRVAGDRRPAPTPSLAGRGPDRPPSAPDEAGFHARVFDRLAEIQGEGQGRWRRLVGSILGREFRDSKT